MNTYDQRNTDYRIAHGFSEEMLQTFVQSFQIKEGDAFIELMSGNGIVSQEASRQYKGMPFSCTLLDAYSAQLPKNTPYTIITEDIRIMDKVPPSFTIAAMKSGIHEIPKHQQEQVFRNIYHIVKPGGKLCLWELACKTTQSRAEIQALSRKKNELAGFTDLAQNRHFNTLAQLLSKLNSAGFEDINLGVEQYFTLNTKNWLNNDLGGDQEKLDELNQYIRENFDFEDHGTHLTKEFYWPVIVARK